MFSEGSFIQLTYHEVMQTEVHHKQEQPKEKSEEI